MISIDLVTGFLGSGKTTFLNKYINYLAKYYSKIGVIVNDYGAINIDMLMIDDNPNIIKEMIVSSDEEIYKSRLKSKLISLKLQGIDYLVFEPSGLFKMDILFDILNEYPINDYYNLNSVIGVLDCSSIKELSSKSLAIMATELSYANSIVLTHMDKVVVKKEEIVSFLNNSFNIINCNRVVDDSLVLFDGLKLDDCKYNIIKGSGYYNSYCNNISDINSRYDTLYFMDCGYNLDVVISLKNELLSNLKYGNILRIKGFVKSDINYILFNITRKDETIRKVTTGQDVFIIIGQSLNKDAITSFLSTKK